PRLAHPRADPARDALARALGAGGRFQRVQFHSALQPHEVVHPVDHSPYLWRVLDLDRLGRAPKNQAAHRRAGVRPAVDGALAEGDADLLLLGHVGLRLQAVISSIDLPRFAAICAGVFILFRPSIVARTTL